MIVVFTRTSGTELFFTVISSLPNFNVLLSKMQEPTLERSFLFITRFPVRFKAVPLPSRPKLLATTPNTVCVLLVLKRMRKGNCWVEEGR